MFSSCRSSLRYISHPNLDALLANAQHSSISRYRLHAERLYNLLSEVLTPIIPCSCLNAMPAFLHAIPNRKGIYTRCRDLQSDQANASLNLAHLGNAAWSSDTDVPQNGRIMTGLIYIDGWQYSLCLVNGNLLEFILLTGFIPTSRGIHCTASSLIRYITTEFLTQLDQTH